MTSTPRKLISVETVQESIKAITGDGNLFKTTQGMRAFAQIAIEITRGTLRSKPEILKAMHFWGLHKSEPRFYRIIQHDSIVIECSNFSLYTENHKLSLAFKDRNILCRTLGQLLGRLLIENEEILLNSPIPSHTEDEIQRYWAIIQSKADYPLPKQVAVSRILDYGLKQAFSELEQH